GELYVAAKRAGMPFLYVNSRLPQFDGAADLTYWDSDDDDARLLMLGEVKLLGTYWYFSKNFCGGPLKGYLRELDEKGAIKIDASRRGLADARGFLRDYSRLVTYPGPAALLRLLVLVLDTRGEKPNDLGRVLMGVQCDGPGEVVFEDPRLNILCKVW